ncbi:MAG: RadC family protein [Caldisericaceae bacterium]
MDKSQDASKEVYEFLATNQIYPQISRNGTITFKSQNGVQISQEQQLDLLRTLKISTPEECKRVRDYVKELRKQVKSHVPIKDWVKEERPRELLVKNGSQNLTLAKLLAIILRTGSVGKSAEELARNILDEFKTLRNLDSATIDEICKIQGIGIAKAAQIKAAFEIGKRLMHEQAESTKKIRSPREALQYVSEYFAPYLRDAKNEFFFIVLLDIKNKPIKHVEISKGSINASIVDPKEVVKEASLSSASSVILLHNHPSGETEPSEEDLKITSQIVKALELVNVKVLDHIILGKNHDDFFSFANAGIL